jgi:hypothetical protein
MRRPVYFNGARPICDPHVLQRIASGRCLPLRFGKRGGLRSGENPARWRGNLDQLPPKLTRAAPREQMSASALGTCRPHRNEVLFSGDNTE